MWRKLSGDAKAAGTQYKGLAKKNKTKPGNNHDRPIRRYENVPSVLSLRQVTWPLDISELASASGSPVLPTGFEGVSHQASKEPVHSLTDLPFGGGGVCRTSSR